MPFALSALLAAALAPQTPTSPPTTPATPQIEWQRSLADALAVQQATGKPLLLVLNLDGETFCEQFANRTYRDPSFVADTRGYVCLIASGERHTDSDYDGQGRRIECPRFGGCTCSEHVNNGVRMFAKYLKGESAAPRHLGLAPDGTVLFDRFLDHSMKLAIDAIAAHRGKDDASLPSDPKALLARRDAAARAELERRYRAADAAGRMSLLAAAADSPAEPFDLLRMPLRSADAAEFAAAARALARTATKDALIDLEDALARCDDAALQGELERAVELLAATDPAALQFARQHDAVGKALADAQQAACRATLGTPVAALERDAAEQALDAAEAAARKAPKDGAARLAVAFATLELARALPPDSQNANLLRQDARRAAETAAPLATDEDQTCRANAVRAIVLAAAGDLETARAFADVAMHRFTPAAPSDAAPLWVADLLRAAARSHAAAAYQKATQDPQADLSPLLTRAGYAFALLVEHHAATEADLREAAACLAFAGQRRAAQELLLRAVARFPGSNDLHAELRNRLALDRGADGLRRAYAALADRASAASGADAPTLRWFQGYAELVAAEMWVKEHDARARIAYEGALAQFAASAAGNPDYADSANHFAVLAHAGLALLLHQAGDADGAVAHLLAARALRPASMNDADGLGRKPQAVLERIARELGEQGKSQLAARLGKDG